MGTIIWDYLRAVIHYWWLIVPGLAMPLSNIWRWHHPERKELPIPLWIRVGIASGALILAQFLAYRDSIKNLSQVIIEKRDSYSRNAQLTQDVSDKKAEVEQLKQQVHGLQEQLAGKPKVITRNVQVPVQVPSAETTEEKQRRQAIRNTLSKFMLRGAALRDRCSEDITKDSAPLRAEADQWFREVREYLKSNLGESYLNQFLATYPEAISPSNVFTEERIQLWHGLHERIIALNKFIDELK